jgi:carbon-monoxide dehydrogenase large subunit
MRFAGIVMGKATNDIIAKAKRIAAHVLEADAADIVVANGRCTVAGTDRSMGIYEVAAAATTRADVPEDLRGPLGAECDETHRVCAFPFGCHVCEVEVDPETGVVELVRYAAVDDVGRAINPLILHGQTHGAIAQGVGQALWEHAVYDPGNGEMLSASFMDYAMPRADLLPSFDTEISEVPSVTNPLGIRAGGEGGTTPALGVVVNAVVDALAACGVVHIDMPLTPERVWRAMRDARPGPASSTR